MKEEISMQVQSAVVPLATILTEMRGDLRAHIIQETERISSIDERMDEHLKIYANNGLESKRVADTLSMILGHSLERDKKVDDMWLSYQGFSWTAKWFPWVLSIIAGILAIIYFKK